LHPGNLIRPRSRRTSEEVAAATARKEELKAQLARAEQEKIELLARMALDEDTEADVEETATVRGLGESDDDEKNGQGNANDAGPKKARTCKSTAYRNTNSYP
jgi:hypothetical protein